MLEQWKEITDPIYPKGRYLVSNLGRVKSRTFAYYTGEYHSKRINKGHFLSQSTSNPRVSKKGYKFVVLRKKDGGQKSEFVHKLVAQYFIKDYDKTKTVHHIDFDTFNNKVTNLKVLSQAENNKQSNEYRLKSVDNAYQKGNHASARPIKLIKDNEVILFRSISKASWFLFNKPQNKHLTQVLTGKRNSVKGYKAEYISTAEYRKSLVSKW